MLRDNLAGLIEPMLSSAGANPLALCTARKKSSDDRPPCLENPRPEGAESTLTENAASPFHAEPKQYDALGRVTNVAYPDGGSTTNTYVDTAPMSVATTVAITSTLNETTNTLLDGLGRELQSQFTSDPSGTDYTDTTYDPLERVASVSNPYRTTSDTTYGITSYVYDELGRTCVVVRQDGSAVSNTACPTTAPSGDVFTTYVGKCTTVTDEAGNARKSCVDGLGRLTSVFEDPAGLDYETDYTYDGFNNLTGVTQKGGSSSSNWRIRSFTYDGMSRLTQAVNPESGTIKYAYTTPGGTLCAAHASAVCTKTAPSPNQLSAGTKTVVTTYTYDALSRLTGKSYVDGYTSNPATPSVTYGYDGTAPSGCTQPTVVSPTNSGIPTSPTNTIGRRSGMCDGSGATAWVFDSMGRPTIEERKINGVTKNIGYVYYLGGQPKYLWYPSDHRMNFGVTSAGRINGESDENDNYVADNATFNPHGTIYSMSQYAVSGSIGVGYTSYFVYNKRLQHELEYSAYTSSSGLTYLYQRCYDYHLGGGVNITYGTFRCSFSTTTPGNNGNVYQITNNLNTARTQTFTYDSLNRINQAYSSGTIFGQQFNIDPWANLTSVTAISGKPLDGGFTSSASTANQLSGYTYDTAGNMLGDGNGAITYDDENRISTTAGVTYTYDGDGKRVEKSNGTLFWTGVGSDPLSESDLSGNINEEYVFFNGMRVSRIDRPSGTVHGFLADHLGSSRMSVVPSGANTLMVEEDLDYTPYGILASGTATDHYEFTGKERDAESGNDYFGARYYASSMGRWMHPDKPFADQHLTDPQSWNLYVYVRNNPLIHKDDAGRACSALNGSSGYCQRADLYGNFDLLVGGKTRFYAATSAISQSLANVAIPGLGRIGTSPETRSLLDNIGQSLQALNTATVGKIVSGQITMSGLALDSALVHKEQNQVQSVLDGFKRSNPEGYAAAIEEINALLNPDQRGTSEGGLGAIDKAFFGTDKAMDGIIQGVEKSLGHDIDFGNQGDREALGNAVVDHIRKTGGCDITGNKSGGCS